MPGHRSAIVSAASAFLERYGDSLNDAVSLFGKDAPPLGAAMCFTYEILRVVSSNKNMPYSVCRCAAPPPLTKQAIDVLCGYPNKCRATVANKYSEYKFNVPKNTQAGTMTETVRTISCNAKYSSKRKRLHSTALAYHKSPLGYSTLLLHFTASLPLVGPIFHTAPL